MNPIRVLLIDDDVEYSATLAKRLGRRGFTVCAVDGGQAALTVLETENFDVAVLDIKMPGMDGVQVLSELKRTHPELAVIMLTAHATTDVVISSLAMGAAEYLMKPADLKELTQRIRATVKRKSEGNNRQRPE